MKRSEEPGGALRPEAVGAVLDEQPHGPLEPGDALGVGRRERDGLFDGFDGGGLLLGCHGADCTQARR